MLSTCIGNGTSPCEGGTAGVAKPQAVWRPNAACGLALVGLPRFPQPPRVRGILAMPGVQRPAVVRLDKRPTLRRQPAFRRGPLNVANSSSHVRGLIQEHFPTGRGPNGMIRRAKTATEQPQPADLLEVLDHLLGRVLVFADEHVNVVGEDRARITRVPLMLD